MKKIQVVFAAAAVLMAAAGVFANVVDTVRYFRPIDAHYNQLLTECAVEIFDPCVETGTLQCVNSYSTQLPGEGLTSKPYSISKIRTVSGEAQPCQIVKRAN